MPLKFNPFTGNFDLVSDLSPYTLGASSSTDNAITRFDGVTGKLIQNSSVLLSDNGDVQNINTAQFDTTPTSATPTEGQLSWNATDGTLDLGMSGGDINLQIGQEMFAKVRNNTGVTIDNGTPVYYNGSIGNRPTIAKAKADAENTGRFAGLTTQDILDNTDGYITTVGYVRQIKTNYSGSGIWGTTWVEGDLLYVSKTDAGVITNVQPSAPHHSDTIGIVGVVGPVGTGSILVSPTKHVTLEGLSDVNGTALTTDGQIPNWHNSSGYFDFDKNINDYATTSAMATADNLRVLKAGDTMTGSLAITGGSLTLNNATANRVYYGNTGVAAPGASSAGQKIQLYGTAGTVGAGDYALGIESGNMWVSTGTGGLKVYRNSGATLAAELNSSGNLRLGSTATISSKLTFDSATNAAGGILFGSDTNLYRLTTDHLTTDDKLSATGGLARTGLIMSPESADSSVIPYYQNDLAYNRLRGGATRVYYDGVLQAGTDANTDNLFTPTSTAFNINTTGITTVVIEIDMCVSLSYTTKIGYAANEVWRARDIIVEAYITATATWSTVGSVTDVAYGEKYFTYSGNPGTISKIRFTFSDFYKAGGAYEIFRVGTIYTLNYASAMGSGFFVTRDAGSIYGDLTMSGAATQILFPNNSDNTGGLLFGADTNLFRSAANVLTTDDSLTVGTNLTVTGTTALNGTLTMGDADNIILNTTTGSKIATATTQKLAFWNATPIVQPTTAVTAATFAANTSAIVDDTATFDGYTIGQVVKALRSAGLLA